MSMPGVTLLLNASYEPLSVVSWQRAITMLFSEKVEVLEVYEDKEIRSSTISLKMPSVVRLIRYIRRPRLKLRFSRQNVYFRDGHTCQYCGESVPNVELTLDHVVPRSQGGPTTWTNIVACCVDCNREKGGRTPEEAEMPLLSRPVKPKTLAHIGVKKTSSRTPEEWRTYLTS